MALRLLFCPEVDRSTARGGDFAPWEGAVAVDIFRWNRYNINSVKTAHSPVIL